MHYFHDMTSRPVSLVLVLIVSAGLIFTGASGTGLAVEPSPDALMQQGLQAYQRGSFDQALGASKQAADLFKASGNAPAQVEALILAAVLTLVASRTLLRSIASRLGELRVRTYLRHEDDQPTVTVDRCAHDLVAGNDVDGDGLTREQGQVDPR